MDSLKLVSKLVQSLVEAKRCANHLTTFIIISYIPCKLSIWFTERLLVGSNDYHTTISYLIRWQTLTADESLIVRTVDNVAKRCLTQ